ncbi:hypothetical protein D3C80_1696470 [compost metagenome]
MGQDGRNLQGTQVGVQAHGLADGQQTLFGADRRAVPLGSADRAQQDGVGGQTGGLGLFGQGLAGRVDGGAADQVLGELEAVAVDVADAGQDPLGGQGDFRPDAVAGQDHDIEGAGVGHQMVSGSRKRSKVWM